MRLTLRTLLAYLDDVLEPSQTREIGSKLNESSLASSLVSRIREVMRRRRLTAPTLSGPGVGIDPNAVGEYLDNTLPPDGVADVEKICLESDVHLAEVAACHQILTLALGEPVEIPTQTRERMYALGPAAAKMSVVVPQNGARAHGVSTDELPSEALSDVLRQAEPIAAAAPAVSAMPTTAAPRFEQELPAYLRRRSPVKKIIGYTAAAAVLVVWAVLAFQRGPFQPERKGPPAANVAVFTGAPSDDEAPGDQSEPDEAAAANDKVESTRPVAGAAADEEGNAIEAPAVAATSRAAAGRTAADAALDLPVPDEPEEDAPPFRRRAAGDEPPAANEPPAVATATEEAADEAEDTAPPVVPAPPAKYVSPEGIVLHYERTEKRWMVLPRRALVHGGELIAVPEPFEGTLEFDDARGTVMFTGRSALRWMEPAEGASAGFELRRGQAVLRALGTSGDAANPLRIGIVIGSELWRLALDPATTVGIEVIPREPMKFEQEPGKMEYAGGIYVTAGGKVSVTDPSGRESRIEGPGWLKLPVTEGGGNGKGVANPPLLAVPRWIGPHNPGSTDRQYARLFEKKFNVSEAVDLSLPAVAADPNPMLSRLGTEALGLIDAYGELVSVMKRTQHDEARRAAISALRLWLTRSADHRALLKTELAHLYPPDQADLVYKLLWGYEADEVRDKAGSHALLDAMEHPETSIRELAFSVVYRLTGKTHDYRASAKPLQIQSSLNRWRQHVSKEGGLLPPLKAENGTSK